MGTRFRLLQDLANGGVHSGEKLALSLGISRAAVWKHLQAIKSEYGVEVDAIPGKGYRIKQPLELLSAQQIQGYLGVHTRNLIKRLDIHQRIDSTNTWLMQQASLAADSGSVCMAEQQTSGKGRHGRVWHSPFGRNIYLSLLWRFELSPSELTGLSLAAGIALIRTLRQYNCWEAGLKWPNDVLWRGKKLAGLLLEMTGESTGPSHVVIGVGLNVHMHEEAGEIDQPWVDLSAIPGVPAVSRNELVAVLLTHILDVIEVYQVEGLAGFIDEWHKYDLLKGQEVVVHSAQHVFQGEHLGIDVSGGIRVKIDGEPRTFYAGEVSLRASVG